MPITVIISLAASNIFPATAAQPRTHTWASSTIAGSGRQVELEPYRQLFAQGFADSVMTAHVVNRQLDGSGLPATLSAPILSGLLRDRLGFAGVVISDDLQMRAISDKWSYAEAVQNALLAGVDLIIVCNVLAREEDAVGKGIRAVEELLAERPDQ